MLTGKQRSYLKALANSIEPVIHIGKGGINDNLLKQFDDVLEARELVKAVVLENSMLEVREACETAASLLNAGIVQIIGRKFVLYRESLENKEIQLPYS